MGEAGRGPRRPGRGAAGHARRRQGGGRRTPSGPSDSHSPSTPAACARSRRRTHAPATSRPRRPDPHSCCPRGGWERALGVALAAGVRAAPRSSPPDAAARPSSCMSDAKTVNHTGTVRGRRGFYLDCFGAPWMCWPRHCRLLRQRQLAIALRKLQGSGFARRLVRRSAVAGAARGLEGARRPPSAPGALVGPARPPPGRAAASRAAAQPGDGAGAGAEGAAGDRDDGALGGGRRYGQHDGVG